MELGDPNDPLFCIIYFKWQIDKHEKPWMPKEEIDKNSHYHIDMFVSTIVWIWCRINNRANLSLTDDQDDIYDQ